VRRALVVNKGGDRQVQREPNAHDFPNDHHGRLTVGYLRPFRAEPSCQSRQGMRVQCTTLNQPLFASRLLL
jgi:hypothetical protein